VWHLVRLRQNIAACSASSEVMWLQKLLARLFDLNMDVTCIFCDNQSCIKLSENIVFHDKLKHIEIKYHYIRDLVQKGAMKLWYIATDEQIADVWTKPLSKIKFEYFKDKLAWSRRISLARGGDELQMRFQGQ
jgi:hypothetical protein